MNFMKGIMFGGMITTGVFLMYSEMSNQNKKKVMKKGKQAIKKMGII